MDRRERRDFLERLVTLRAVYRLRGTYDAEPAIAIDVAVAWAERLMRAMRATGPEVRLS